MKKDESGGRVSAFIEAYFDVDEAIVGLLPVCIICVIFGLALIKVGGFILFR